MGRCAVAVLLFGACLVGCRDGDLVVAGDYAAGGVRSESETEPRSAPSDSPAEADGGAATAGSSTTEASAGTAAAGAAELDEGCTGEAVTFEELHSGRVRAGIPVTPGRVVASSQKFLVSEAKSGSCLWGAFAAAEGLSGPGSGLFLVSFGDKHAEGQACVSGTDGLPDDLAPGDQLEPRGFFEEYAPAACTGSAPSPQLRIDATCPVRRVGHGSPPEPERIDFALADRLAAGSDQGLLRAYAGSLVRLEAASARQDPDDGDAVQPFGVIQLEQTTLEVRSRLYYFDLSEGGPRAAAKGPKFQYPTDFRSLTGLVFLDYCTWGLAPRDRCSDLSPASAGCPVQAPGP